MASNINDNIDVTLPAEQTGGYAGTVLKTKFVETLTSLKSGLTVAKSEITALQDGGIDAESVQDIIASTIESGDNITTAYNDTTGKLTISADLFAEEFPVTASRNLLSSDQANILVNAGTTDLTITILTEAVSGIQAGAVQGFFTSSTGKFVFAGLAITGTAPTQAANAGFEIRYRGGDVWVYEGASGLGSGSGNTTQSPTKTEIEAGLNLALGDVVMILPTGGGTLTIPIPTGVVASKEYKFTFQKQVADVWHLIFRGTPDISFDMIDGTDAVLKFSGNADATRLLMLGA